MRCVLILALLTAAPALADGGIFSRLEGVYGAAEDEELSCATNPHRLSFTQSPPHAVLKWKEEWVQSSGLLSDIAVYDLIQVTDTEVVMRLEGEHRRTDAGDRVIWVMRPNEDFTGYCWGRTDWPVVRCVWPQVRCPNEAPTS